MRLSFSFLVISLLFMGSCKTQKVNNGNAPILLSYSRTPCFGTCEVFDLTVYTDGKAEINKKQYMQQIGVFTLNLSKKELKTFEASFESAAFCQLDSIYGAGIADLPSSIITYNCEGNYKTVEAVMNYPQGVKTIIEEMALFSKRTDWTPVNFD